MSGRLAASIGLSGALVLSGCASVMQDRPKAPQPLRIVDQRKLFSGVWHEYARTPGKETRGCSEPTAEFYRDGDGLLLEKDVCRLSGRRAKERVAVGAVEILNPGPDSKVLVRFRVMGAFYVPRVTWILDHGVDYDWFIASDPDFRSISIYTRAARPADALKARLVDKLRALGGSESGLEYPAPADPDPGATS